MLKESEPLQEEPGRRRYRSYYTPEDIERRYNSWRELEELRERRTDWETYSAWPDYRAQADALARERGLDGWEFPGEFVTPEYLERYGDINREIWRRHLRDQREREPYRDRPDTWLGTYFRFDPGRMDDSLYGSPEPPASAPDVPEGGRRYHDGGTAPDRAVPRPPRQATPAPPAAPYEGAVPSPGPRDMRDASSPAPQGVVQGMIGTTPLVRRGGVQGEWLEGQMRGNFGMVERQAEAAGVPADLLASFYMTELERGAFDVHTRGALSSLARSLGRHAANNGGDAGRALEDYYRELGLGRYYALRTRAGRSAWARPAGGGR
jgi:hypothetical protein